MLYKRHKKSKLDEIHDPNSNKLRNSLNYVQSLYGDLFKGSSSSSSSSSNEIYSTPNIDIERESFNEFCELVDSVIARSYQEQLTKAFGIY